MSQANPERLLSGRYRLVREIARGGMAAVWQAHDVLLDRMVAVKLLHPQFADDPEFLERFGREARAAARLSHPNIVPIYDVGEDAQTRTPFIVMELVEGGNLKDRIRREAPLPDADVRSIGAALATTLDYAHQKGLVHRDVKPQNVLLGEDGRPRLTDFGIAQAMAATGLTRTGAVMGSVHYIAPELVRGRQATPQSDVYSLGVVLYEMATGRVPFQAETDLAVALAHVEQTPPAPRALNAHLAPDLERTILRALARSPEQRFLRAADLADALRQGANGVAAPRRAAPAVVPVGPGAAQATQRMPTPPRASAANRMAGPAVVGSPAPFARRPARPRQMRGPGGGVLALLLALAAVLVALGAGFFGLASLSREGVASSEPTTPPTARPTAAPKPAGVPTSTPLPAATATTEPSATPTLATPTPATPTPAPPSPSPTPRPTPRSIPVPQLRGKTLDEAQAALRSDGLTATVKGIAANIDKDVVADQSPDVGTTLPPGGTVTILVGTGYTAVPNVSNTPRDQALRTLQNNSFRVTVRERRDARIPAGVAIGTNPAAGTILTRGSDVELDISSGR